VFSGTLGTWHRFVLRFAYRIDLAPGGVAVGVEDFLDLAQRRREGEGLRDTMPHSGHCFVHAFDVHVDPVARAEDAQDVDLGGEVDCTDIVRRDCRRRGNECVTLRLRRRLGRRLWIRTVDVRLSTVDDA
jgi:hypothetical protein